jgi:hypothetical protein
MLRIINLDGTTMDIDARLFDETRLRIGERFDVRGKRYIVADNDFEDDEPELVWIAMELRSDA